MKHDAGAVHRAMVVKNLESPGLPSFRADSASRDSGMDMKRWRA